MGSAHGFADLLRSNEEDSAFQFVLSKSAGRREDSVQDWDNNPLHVAAECRDISRLAVPL